MVTRIIDFSLRHRLAVIAMTVAFAILGAVSLSRLDIDAFPDITPVQIQINTVVPQLNPAEVEQRVTYPVEQALAGMPKLENIRSLSKFGLSQVIVTFTDDTDMLVARQLVNERLATVVLPPEVERPKMGPMSNGLGEVFHYIVLSHGEDRTKARTIQEWVIKPQVRAVPGVAEVNSWGGYGRQFQVRIRPTALISYDLTFDQVVTAVDQNNRNVGGGVVRRGGSMLLVHGLGRVSDLEELRNIVVTTRNGQPIFLKQVADVVLGDDGPLRRGSVTFDGKGEAMLGLGFMTTGENSHTVTTAMRERLAEVSKTLPRDVEVVPVYDRTELIDVVIDTARKNLFEGGLLVIAVLFAFLGNLRAAFIVALAIPLSMLVAFTGMYRFAISASLLSLGAIDFGMVVDSSVVMVENCVRKGAMLEPTGLRRGWRSWFPFSMFFESERIPREVVRDAAVEVRQPTLFGELIILVVYLPILTLEGIEGKLFRPMALTVIFALAGSMVMSLTLMPVLASLILPRHTAHSEPWLLRALKAVYAPTLRLAMRYKYAVLGLAGPVLALAFGVVAPSLGEEYIPKLTEGSISINIIRPVGTKLETSNESNSQIERAVLRAFPNEVKHVWSRVGSADVATDPMGVELTDFFMTLHPRSQWKRAKTQDELTRHLEDELRGFLGNEMLFTQPIEMRIDETFSGTRGQVAVKVHGDDLQQIKAIAATVQGVLRETGRVEGKVNVEPVEGQPVLQVRPKPKELAHHGIPAKAILDLVEAIGGRPLGEVVEGQLRFPIVALLPRDIETKPEAIRDIIIPAPNGDRLPLYQLADISVQDGPPTIFRERGQRRLAVTCNLRDSDVRGFVEAAKREVAAKVKLPEGGRYTIEWGGEYEQMQRANARLWLVRGLALALVVVLLYLAYQNITDTLRVLVGIPFAMVGGIVALYLRDMPFSVSAQIGFIAVAGVAVLDDMILVSYIRQLRDRGLGIDEAVEQAAITRLRPVLMTTLVASLGFVPMAFSTGQGAEVQRPLATVVIGGVISALVMSLLVLRVLYVVFRPRPQLASSQEP